MSLTNEQKHDERRKTLLVWLLNNDSNYASDIRKGCKMLWWHVSPLLTELVAEGLVSCTEDQRRRNIYGLTEKGRTKAIRFRRQS